MATGRMPRERGGIAEVGMVEEEEWGVERAGEGEEVGGEVRGRGRWYRR
jgi:hypothetical protein